MEVEKCAVYKFAYDPSNLGVYTEIGQFFYNLKWSQVVLRNRGFDMVSDSIDSVDAISGITEFDKIADTRGWIAAIEHDMRGVKDVEITLNMGVFDSLSVTDKEIILGVLGVQAKRLLCVSYGAYEDSAEKPDISLVVRTMGFEQPRSSLVERFAAGLERGHVMYEGLVIAEAQRLGLPVQKLLI